METKEVVKTAIWLRAHSGKLTGLSVAADKAMEAGIVSYKGRYYAYSHTETEEMGKTPTFVEAKVINLI